MRAGNTFGGEETTRTATGASLLTQQAWMRRTGLFRLKGDRGATTILGTFQDTTADLIAIKHDAYSLKGVATKEGRIDHIKIGMLEALTRELSEEIARRWQ